MEQELKQLWDSLSRGCSGRLIIEDYQEKRMEELIDALFAKALRSEE